MPYIKQADRDRLNVNAAALIRTAGELNFVFTEIIKWYVETHGLEYKAINDVIGALEATKLEFYRRVAVPYEQGKIALNGDVYSEEK